MSKKTVARDRRGFTLMEVLLVLAILVVLGSLSTIFISRMQRQAYISAAETEIGHLHQAVELYQIHMQSFPDTNQGLLALRACPPDAPNPSKWHGPYLKNDIQPDPWGSQYTYTYNGGDSFTISSPGPDRTPGTDDDIVK